MASNTYRTIIPVPPKAPELPPPRGNPSATYRYTNEVGDLCFVIYRYDKRDGGKIISPQSYCIDCDGNHSWKKSIQCNNRPLYGILDLYKHPNKTVLVCEGEKTRDALAGVLPGIPVVTWSGGTAAVDKTDFSPLFGRKLCLWPDNDLQIDRKTGQIKPEHKQPGMKAMLYIADKLLRSASLIKIVKPDPDLPNGYDAADFIGREGYDGAAIKQYIAERSVVVSAYIAESVPAEAQRKLTPTVAPKAEPGNKRLPYAEMSNSFLLSYRDDENRLTIRYYRGSWYRYQGSYYEVINKTDVESEVLAYLRREHEQHATKNTLANIMANLVSADLCYVNSTLDAPIWLDSGVGETAEGWVGMTNTICNVNKLSRGEHSTRTLSPGFFSTYGLPYAYDPDATCPRWELFISDVQPEEWDQKILQMLCGLCLIPWANFNAFWILYGEGGTGKSVFLHILRRLVGEQNTCSLAITEFDSRFRARLLTEKLVNIVGDLPTEDFRGKSLNRVEGLLKEVCDHGTITCERKWQHEYQAPAMARNIFAGNSIPRFVDKSDALWERLRVIAFDQRFRGTEAENPNLRTDLESELPGIFIWAVRGLRMLREYTTFPEHSRGVELKEKHRGSCDIERQYITDTYEYTGNANDYVRSSEAYQNFKSFLKENGYAQRSEHTFADAFERVYNTTKIRRRIPGEGHVRIYSGVKNIIDEKPF